MLRKLLRTADMILQNPGALRARMTGADASPYLLLSKPWVKALDIKTVLDVGANVGRWAKACRLALPAAEIHSFEPIPACQEQMKKLMAGDALHFVHPVALGRTTTTNKLKLHNRLSSSSFLVETDQMHKLSTQSVAGDEIAVRVERLDDLLRTGSWQAPYLLKLDVQGYELEVLAGAENALEGVAAVVVETSFRELYRQQPVFHDIYSFLRTAGFDYIGAGQIVLQSKNGLDVQQDSLFVRRSKMDCLGW